MDGYGRWIYFVRTLVGWFNLRFPCAGRMLGLRSTNRAGSTFPDVLRARLVGLVYSLERTAVWLCKPG